MFEDQLQSLLDPLPTLSLEEMSAVKLMSRIDTKYLTNKDGLLRVLSLAQNDYYVQAIDGQEIMNYLTVYLDTPSHYFYHEHLRGALPRTKLRMRTYLDSDGLTFFEIKRKNNRRKTKKRRITIGSMETAAETGAPEFLLQERGLVWEDYTPSLRNQFKRITLVNRGMTERLTIDFDIQYHSFRTGLEAQSGSIVIIELKRGSLVGSPIRSILTQLHIHPAGYSKYMMGSAMTDPSLRRDKRKFVYLSKTAERVF